MSYIYAISRLHLKIACAESASTMSSNWLSLVALVAVFGSRALVEDPRPSRHALVLMCRNLQWGQLKVAKELLSVPLLLVPIRLTKENGQKIIRRLCRTPSSSLTQSRDCALAFLSNLGMQFPNSENAQTSLKISAIFT